MIYILLITSIMLLALGISIQYKQNVDFLVSGNYEYTEKQRSDISNMVGVRVIVMAAVLSGMAIASMINYLLFAPFALLFLTLLIMLIEKIYEFNKNVEENSKKQMIKLRVRSKRKK